MYSLLGTNNLHSYWPSFVENGFDFYGNNATTESDIQEIINVTNMKKGNGKRLLAAWKLEKARNELIQEKECCMSTGAIQDMPKSIKQLLVPEPCSESCWGNILNFSLNPA